MRPSQVDRLSSTTISMAVSQARGLFFSLSGSVFEFAVESLLYRFLLIVFEIQLSPGPTTHHAAQVWKSQGQSSSSLCSFFQDREAAPAHTKGEREAEGALSPNPSGPFLSDGVRLWLLYRGHHLPASLSLPALRAHSSLQFIVYSKS